MPATPKFSLTPFQKAVVVGTLLGDSSLSRPHGGRNFHLSCYHAIRQKAWLIQKHQWLAPVSKPIHWCAYLDKRDGKTRAGGRFHTASIPDLTMLAHLFYQGHTKIIRPSLLTLLTHPVSLACLICDDGSWDGAGIAIASKAFTKQENIALATHLANTFKLSVTPQLNGQYAHIRITAISVDRVKQLCLEFVPNSLRYKFGPSNYQTRRVLKTLKPCQWCHQDFLSYSSAQRKFCSRKCATHGKPKFWTGGRSSPRTITPFHDRS